MHRYLPRLSAEPYDAITIYHLLTHTSGLPRISYDPSPWKKMSTAVTPVDEYVALASEMVLFSKPGERYQYSAAFASLTTVQTEDTAAE